VHHEIQEAPEIADAKPSKGLINLFGGFLILLALVPKFGEGKIVFAKLA
jgi:hypothetical protein